MATKKVRPSRSKQTLQDELAEVQSAFMSREELDPTTVREEAKRKSALAGKLSGITSRVVTEKIGELGLTLQSALDTIRLTLVSSVQELEELRELIEATAKELEEVHGKEVVASSIQSLIAEFELKQAEFIDEENRRRKDLEDKIAATLAAEKERKAATEKARQQENEDYEYKLGVQRREAIDAFDQEMRKRTREQQDIERDLKRGWQEREAALKAQEKEVVELKNMVVGFDALVDAEKKKAVAQATGAMSQNHKHEIEILTAKAASDKSLLESKLENLAAQLAAANSTIAALNAKLTAAENRVESIAKSAMERDSGRSALEAQSQTIKTMTEASPTKR